MSLVVRSNTGAGLANVTRMSAYAARTMTWPESIQALAYVGAAAALAGMSGALLSLPAALYVVTKTTMNPSLRHSFAEFIETKRAESERSHGLLQRAARGAARVAGGAARFAAIVTANGLIRVATRVALGATSVVLAMEHPGLAIMSKAVPRMLPRHSAAYASTLFALMSFTVQVRTLESFVAPGYIDGAERSICALAVHIAPPLRAIVPPSALGLGLGLGSGSESATGTGIGTGTGTGTGTGIGFGFGFGPGRRRSGASMVQAGDVNYSTLQLSGTERLARASDEAMRYWRGDFTITSIEAMNVCTYVNDSRVLRTDVNGWLCGLLLAEAAYSNEAISFLMGDFSDAPLLGQADMHQRFEALMPKANLRMHHAGRLAGHSAMVTTWALNQGALFTAAAGLASATVGTLASSVGALASEASTNNPAERFYNTADASSLVIGFNRLRAAVSTRTPAHAHAHSSSSARGDARVDAGADAGTDAGTDAGAGADADADASSGDFVLDAPSLADARDGAGAAASAASSLAWMWPFGAAAAAPVAPPVVARKTPAAGTYYAPDRTTDSYTVGTRATVQRRTTEHYMQYARSFVELFPVLSHTTLSTSGTPIGASVVHATAHFSALARNAARSLADATNDVASRNYVELLVGFEQEMSNFLAPALGLLYAERSDADRPAQVASLLNLLSLLFVPFIVQTRRKAGASVFVQRVSVLAAVFAYNGFGLLDAFVNLILLHVGGYAIRPMRDYIVSSLGTLDAVRAPTGDWFDAITGSTDAEANAGADAGANAGQEQLLIGPDVDLSEFGARQMCVSAEAWRVQTAAAQAHSKRVCDMLLIKHAPASLARDHEADAYAYAYAQPRVNAGTRASSAFDADADTDADTDADADTIAYTASESGYRSRSRSRSNSRDDLDGGARADAHRIQTYVGDEVKRIDSSAKAASSAALADRASSLQSTPPSALTSATQRPSIFAPVSVAPQTQPQLPSMSTNSNLNSNPNSNRARLDALVVLMA